MNCCRENGSLSNGRKKRYAFSGTSTTRNTLLTSVPYDFSVNCVNKENAKPYNCWMVSKISQMMLQSTTEIRCISITGIGNRFSNAFTADFTSSNFSPSNISAVFYEGIHFITGNTASIRRSNSPTQRMSNRLQAIPLAIATT